MRNLLFDFQPLMLKTKNVTKHGQNKTYTISITYK